MPGVDGDLGDVKLDASAMEELIRTMPPELQRQLEKEGFSPQDAVQFLFHKMFGGRM